MSDEYLKAEKPAADKGWIEYGLMLLWSETEGYEHVSDNAAEELAQLRAALEEAKALLADGKNLSESDRYSSLLQGFFVWQTDVEKRMTKYAETKG